MTARFLEVTYRNGTAMAAYLHLPRVAGAKVHRTAEMAPGLLVDFDSRGSPIGVEITAPSKVGVAAVNAVLERLGVARLRPREWSPLAA